MRDDTKYGCVADCTPHRCAKDEITDVTKRLVIESLETVLKKKIVLRGYNGAVSSKFSLSNTPTNSQVLESVTLNQFVHYKLFHL